MSAPTVKLADARVDIAKLRVRFSSWEIATKSGDTEIVYCEEHNGEYVGWTPREHAERMGYTIARTDADAEVLALLDELEALRAREGASPSAPARTGTDRNA